MTVKKDANDATEKAPEAVEVIKKDSAAEEQKTSTIEPAGNADGFCVYLGPNIRGVIQSGTVYSGAKEQAIASVFPAIEKYPLIAELIVTEGTLAVDRVKVKTAGNLLNVNYMKLASKLKSN